MTCIVCHRSVGTHAKKCPGCGAPTVISSGEFLFKMNVADEKQLKRYYEQWQEANNEETSTTNRTSPGTVTTPSSSTSRSRTDQSSVTPSQRTQVLQSDNFLEKHGLNVLKYLSWSSLVAMFFIGYTISGTLSAIIVAIILAFSAYLIYTQMCYTSKRSMTFWICIAVSAVAAVIAFVLGKNSTTLANNYVMTLVDFARSEQADVVQQLMTNYSSTFKSTISPAFILPMFLNLTLVNNEVKNNKISKIIAILGVGIFIILFSVLAYYFGHYMAIKSEILNYCATAFPDQVIVLF